MSDDTRKMMTVDDALTIEASKIIPARSANMAMHVLAAEVRRLREVIAVLEEDVERASKRTTLQDLSDEMDRAIERARFENPNGEKS